MKKVVVFVWLLSLCFSGCVSLNIPAYIKDMHPYKKTFYASYEDVLARAVESVELVGWRTTDSMDPAIFERHVVTLGAHHSQVLLLAVTQGQGKNVRLNVYVREIGAQATEVEVRYLRLISLGFKNVIRYKNDRLAQRLFELIDRRLN